jgi:antitoxin (DNA-binding transcriptional repressor) of toxin-antitoxin stability system
VAQISRRKFGVWELSGLFAIGFVLWRLLDSYRVWRSIWNGPLWVRAIFNDLMSGSLWFLQLGVLGLLGTAAVSALLSRPARAQLADWASDARVRGWATWLPAAAWLAFRIVNAPHFLPEYWQWYAATTGVTMVLQALAFAGAARLILRRLVDTRPENVALREAHADEIIFSAVADSPATRAAVASVAAYALAMCVYVAQTRPSDGRVFAAILIFTGATIGATALFRRASRIAVGLDGVLVSGAGRRKFVAWSAIDEVRVDGATIVVTKGGRVVVRLQPHGDDAERKDALAARFREALEAAKQAKTETGHVHAAHAVGDARLTHSLRGAADYRMPAVTRDQLWSVVEGPAAEPTMRALAAQALAARPEDGDRTRMRVAADKCADPVAKASLVRLLAEQEAEAEAGAELPGVREARRLG